MAQKLNIKQVIKDVELDMFKTCSDLASKSEFLHDMKSSLFSIEHCIEFDVETNAVHSCVM